MEIHLRPVKNLGNKYLKNLLDILNNDKKLIKILGRKKKAIDKC